MSRLPRSAWTRRLLVPTGLASLAIAFTAVPASAHISVASADATQGGFAVIAFRVPTETATASTTSLTVQFPADQPLASVAVQPHPGWTYQVKMVKLAKPISSDDGEVTEAVSLIEWKATSVATGIKPGEFDQFQVSVGPLPKAPTMTFKAIQGYSDGTTVAWIDEAAPGSTVEPDHPAPALALPPAPSGSGVSTGSAGSTGSTVSGGAAASGLPVGGGGFEPASASSAGASTGSVVGAYVIAVLGLLAGLAGLAVGLVARGRRRPEPQRQPTAGAAQE